MNALMRAHCHAVDAVTSPRKPDQKSFADMDAIEQRMEMAYYLMNDQGRFDKPYELMAAINDCIDPRELFAAWQAADVARVWHLIDRAMAKGLEEAIDRGNGL